jgi:hypothetical protein
VHPSSGHTYVYVYIEGRRSRHQNSVNKTASPTHARILFWRLTSMELHKHLDAPPDGSPSPSQEFDLTLQARAASSLERLRERSILQLLKKNIQT